MSDIVQISTSLETADWIARRDELIAAAATVSQVENDADLERAGRIEADAKRLIKTLEDERKRVARPIDALKRQITDREKELRRDIESEVRRVNALTTAYATKVALTREAERRRIEAAERARAEAEAAAQESAAASANALFGLDTPQPVAAQIYVPPETVAAPRTSANRFVETWDFSVTDAARVPREFMSVDEAKIRAFLRAKKAEGYKFDQIEVPGVRITMTMKVQSK